MGKKYWLMKSEPEVYSIDHLKRDKKTYWDGVRNYQARNFLRDQVKAGDQVFFYHSNADPSGIAGIAEVVREGYSDPSQFDSKDVHYDSASTQEKPIWYVVELAFVEKFKEIISLDQLRKIKGLEKMLLLRRGQRLSVMPVSQEEWNIIVK
ncbi:MAG: EVE domain-containing protein [Candidatus Omnitrophica bacterium]|nr:EVE domain-containing protein [Candidatus Omnitrophota bacterium]